MTTAYRLVLVLSILCAALAGGLLATVFAPQPVRAADAAASSAALAFGPQVKLSTFQVPYIGPAFINSEAYMKVGNVGTFTVENAASLVEITHQGRVLGTNSVSTSGLYAQLRVDDQIPLDNTGQAHLRISEDGVYIPLTFSGYWQNLSAGTHTISLWSHVTIPGGSASIAFNPGNWSSNDIIVKEYLPFGATYLPSISNEQELDGAVDPGIESDSR